ncbi:MAG TPA: hypothetical protein VIK51_03770 [Vicinamibacteria bacterium]
MKRLALAAVIVLLLWKVGEACGPWYVLRAALNPVFWQPFAKSIPELLGKPRHAADRAVFAGMAPGGNPQLAAARRAYQAVARWRSDHFLAWEPQEPPLLTDSVGAARRAVDAALAARPSAVEAEELRLIRCKVTLREGESLLLVSRSKVVTPETAPQDALRKARDELMAFIAEARTPALVSEARGWLARCDYLLGEVHPAARIYLDELARADSALDRNTLLASLRILFPYNGSAAGLADHLDEYFDTPQHALFVINLVTNPVEDDENERRAMDAVGRKALAALQRHRELFSHGDDSRRLALAAMRASLYMGDPAAAVRVGAALPPDSSAGPPPEARWMLGVAHVLLGHFDEAEPHLTAVAESTASPPRARAQAQLGLLAVYQKLGRPVDQLVAAFRYEAEQRRRESEAFSPGDEWYVGSWPYLGSLMDLSYLLDVQLTEAELRAAKVAIEAEPPPRLGLETFRGQRMVTAVYLLEYELALRAARREAYEDAASLYAHLGAGVRAERMRTLAILQTPRAEVQSDEYLRRRYEYGAFLGDHSERIFFNDLLWGGLQRYAFLQLQSDRDRPPILLSEEETRSLVANERRFKDAQEERWQAYLVLDEVVESAGHSSLGERAARKAIECLDRINTERFGRESEVIGARTRLVRWLQENRS